MLILDQLNKGDQSLRLLAWGILAGLLVLAGGLWKVQVLSGARYREQQETQSFRTVRVPAIRGRILDRSGQEFARNTPRYRLDLYLDELRPQFDRQYTDGRKALIASKQPAPSTPTASFWDLLPGRFRRSGSGVRLTSGELELLRRQSRFAVVSNVVAEVGRRLRIPLQVSEQALQHHYLTKRALPLPILSNCTPEQVALITEQSWNLPGVELDQVPVRQYPNPGLAVHVVGHLKRDDDHDEEDGRFNYRLRDYRGGLGLEAAFDKELRGIPGARSILVNSAGYRHRLGERMIAQPQPGLDLVTTLDLDLQVAVEQALSTVAGDERGAVVVLDPRTGDLLAMASAPRFDASEFIEGVPTQRWKDFYLAEPARPTMNRATLGQYAPGSTFKIIDAVALLEAGLDPRATLSVQPDPENPSKGRYLLGRRSIRDTAPPGIYDFRRAFIRSSNSYFIDHSLGLGWERLLSWGARFGLGQKTGIGIAEESGNFPTTLDAIEERGWSSGNLANVSIGQEITLTPLQLAVAVGAVANGGTVYWPRLVDRLEPQNPLDPTPIIRFPARQVRTQIRTRPETFDVIRSAMRDDVLDPEGTGKAARIEGFDICGKTGTAEIKGNGRKDKVTWFASFAPFEAPRYVVIVMVESGASGGGTCAPVARRIYEHLHRRERRPERQFAMEGGPR